ncbi:MAG: hypothetical protein JXA33_11115 [Anaerolineae bacterium]|nr:hypothetical protein [Anaerolineae bacterium]
MDKNLGFDRQLLRPWLDVTAALVAETQDPAELRARLEPVLAQDMAGADARRKTGDLLINIWLHTRERALSLWEFAVEWGQTTLASEDRLWLHYGLTLLHSSFFRDCVAIVGQLGRYGEPITTKTLLQRVTSNRGQLGSLPRSVGRVMASLRDWGLLAETNQRYVYATRQQGLIASHTDLEAWLLACVLRVHPAAELPFADLLRLPELFPFRFTVTVDHLRTHTWLAVQRQGVGWEMVRVLQ